MRPTVEEIERLITTIAAMRYFPASEAGIRLEVMELLRYLVGTSEQAEWLRLTLRDQVSEWPGLAGIRGIFCAFHQPADGINAVSELPGFTQEERNARWMEREGERLTGGPENALRLASGAEMKALPLPPEQLAANGRLLRRVEYLGETKQAFRAMPEPTDEDRQATKLLVAKIYGNADDAA